MKIPTNGFITEGDVEGNFVKPFFSEVLGYDDLKWKQRINIKLGREVKNKEADLVIYHKSKPYIVVESKKPTETLSQDVISQVNSYAHAIKAPIGIVTNGKKIIIMTYLFNKDIQIINDTLENMSKNNYKNIISVIHKDNIDKFLDGFVPKKILDKSHDEVKEIKDFRRFFKKIHNLIRDEEKLDPSESFSARSKLLFIKYSDETKKLQGLKGLFNLETILEKEKNGENLESFLDDRFDEAKKLFPYVFDKKEEKLGLKISTIKKLFQKIELDKVNIFDGKTDIKGKAFEEFLPSQLRGKGLGQFFTPREIVNFIVNLSGISYKDVVVDFSCGSGGFLIKAFQEFLKNIDHVPGKLFESYFLKTKSDYIEYIKKNNFFGIDAEPKAARTAKMNMTIRGDGQNISYGNGLDIEDFGGKEYPITEYDGKDDSGSSLILANPPFGSSEKDENILSRYILGSRDSERNSQKTEILFIEKGIKLLKPEGKMLIVLPEGIITNDSYKYVRDYIESEVEIKAIVSLPTHAFVQSGVATIKTIILFVQKFTTEKKKKYDDLIKTHIHEDIKKIEEFDYNIFMGIAKHIGYMPNGNPIKGDLLTDLDDLLKDYQDIENIGTLGDLKINLIDYADKNYQEKTGKISDFDTRGVNKGKISYKIKYSETEDRKDPFYYIFMNNTKQLFKSYTKIGKYIKERDQKISEKTIKEDDLDTTFNILSVINSGKTEINDSVLGEDLELKYKRTEVNDVSYNPYRINVGSIGIIEVVNGLVSPAYVVFGCNGINPYLLIELLRTPFYKMYIDIISTGSIRDDVKFEIFSNVMMPNSLIKLNEGNVEKLEKDIEKYKNNIKSSYKNISDDKSKIIEKIYSLIDA